MRFRNTLILLIIFALLGGYVYFFELNQETTQEESNATDTTLQVLDITADDVLTLEVHMTKGQARLVRDEMGGSWRIEEPVQDAGDDPRINRIVSSLASLRATRTITQTESLNLADFGLAQPTWTITLTLTGGNSEKLVVGDKNPQQSSYYVQHEGDSAIYLVPAYKMDNTEELITNPPIKPTPTPTPTITPTTKPTIAAEVTPQPTASPTPNP